MKTYWENDNIGFVPYNIDLEIRLKNLEKSGDF